MKTETCCKLGEQIQEGNYGLLGKIGNFAITPATGPMGKEGYLLICSNEHHIGVGGMPPELYGELEDVITETRNVISENYSGNIVVFEHGPKLACNKGGGCLEHMHLHALTTDVDILDFLSGHHKREEISGFSKLKEIYDSRKSSYVFLETPERRKYCSSIVKFAASELEGIL